MFYALRNRSKNVDTEDVRKGQSEQVALGEVNLGCSRLSARGGGGRVLRLILAGYVPLASWSSYPILVKSN